MPTVDIDFDNVLWSSERQTDKIFKVDRFTLTIPAGSTSSEYYFSGPTYVDGINPPAQSGSNRSLASFKWSGYFRIGNAWIPFSPITGSSNIVGVSVRADQFGIFAFAPSSIGTDRTVDVVVLYMPTQMFSYSYTDGFTYTSTTSAVVPTNNSARPDIKWSSFDKQATIAGSYGNVYASNGTARRLATIPHGMATRPTTMFSVSFTSLISGVRYCNNYADYINIWRDNTNIYVEYTPPSGTPNNGDLILQVWWYNE